MWTIATFFSTHQSTVFWFFFFLSKKSTKHDPSKSDADPTSWSAAFESLPSVWFCWIKFSWFFSPSSSALLVTNPDKKEGLVSGGGSDHKNIYFFVIAWIPSIAPCTRHRLSSWLDDLLLILKCLSVQNISDLSYFYFWFMSLFILSEIPKCSFADSFTCLDLCHSLCHSISGLIFYDLLLHLI